MATCVAGRDSLEQDFCRPFANIDKQEAAALELLLATPKRYQILRQAVDPVQ